MNLGKLTIPAVTVVTIIAATITASLAYSAGINNNDVRNGTQDAKLQSLDERTAKLEAGFQSMSTAIQRVSESNIEVKTELKNLAQNINDQRLDLKDYIMGKK